jgi:CRISPR-associated protein Csx10
LLSDVILRNSIGQYTVAAETAGEKISQVFGGIRLRHLPERTFIRGTLIGGFNRKWGLPLTQTPAMRMGSVIVFEIEDGDAPTDDQIAQLELQGIGERRAEGFGRLGVNIHGNDNFSITDKITERSSPVSIIDPESVKIAQRIVTRLLRRNLNETVARRANQLGIHITGPSKSQLSRLRLIIREALGKSPTGGREILDSYLNSIEKRVVTRSQFTRNRVDNRTTIDWLRHRFNDESGEEFKDSGSLPKLGSNITASLTPELIYEYNLRLVDAVLMRAAKNRGVN